jgi:cell division protein FtsB
MSDLKEIRDYLPKRSNASMEAGTTAPLHEIYIRFLLEEVDRRDKVIATHRAVLDDAMAENAKLKEHITWLSDRVEKYMKATRS